MIHWDDLEEEDHERLVYLEVKFRVLVPKGTPIDGLGMIISESEPPVDMDWMTVTPLGAPARCPGCGWVAIDTQGYPWGREKLGTEQYCPRCDGGEHE